ncbi:histidine phosphatase family protein [Thalassovita aquimarina]|uniref:Histidine phosphatase family protein n=1 Tax=Thalassovita aquimarina TaxID=2785917 RepID=A0ABS5HPX5_9RHOB|nr:histidine phosphatase family protein [Thalassovita aquimarina]MBR9650963.1 histidine phosphatase family protein [Thalassovita aquimarina]
MSRFFWVRHGPTHAKTMVGWSDLPADLSNSAQLARLDAALPSDALVVSSDLIRAVATADAIAGNRSRLPHDPDLREIHFGDWELKRFDEVEDTAHIRSFWENPGDVRPPGGESWHEVTARVDRAVSRLINDNPGRDIVAVAHFGVILTQLQQALKIGAYEAFSHRIDNLSLTELHWDGTGWQARRFNQNL